MLLRQRAEQLALVMAKYREVRFGNGYVSSRPVACGYGEVASRGVECGYGEVASRGVPLRSVSAL